MSNPPINKTDDIEGNLQREKRGIILVSIIIVAVCAISVHTILASLMFAPVFAIHTLKIYDDHTTLTNLLEEDNDYDETDLVRLRRVSLLALIITGAAFLFTFGMTINHLFFT